MSLIDKFTLADISDTDLRSTVELFIDKGALRESDIIGAVLAKEIAAEGDSKPSPATKSGSRSHHKRAAARGGAGNGGSNGGANGKSHSRKGDSSRSLQGLYLNAMRRVPKTKRSKYNTAATGSREASIKAVNKDFPAQG